MSNVKIETPRLTLVLESIDAARARIDSMPAEFRAMLSAEWLALFESATESDPWIHGFMMVRRDDGATVGQCGFKGPPTADGVVEIAYAVEPDEQGKGYATEAAEGLAVHALKDSGVKLVRAHTLPAENASTRVLTKCGFRYVGETIDPDDGLVWRWETNTMPAGE